MNSFADIESLKPEDQKGTEEKFDPNY